MIMAVFALFFITKFDNGKMKLVGKDVFYSLVKATKSSSERGRAIHKII